MVPPHDRRMQPYIYTCSARLECAESLSEHRRTRSRSRYLDLYRVWSVWSHQPSTHTWYQGMYIQQVGTGGQQQQALNKFVETVPGSRKHLLRAFQQHSSCALATATATAMQRTSELATAKSTGMQELPQLGLTWQRDSWTRTTYTNNLIKWQCQSSARMLVKIREVIKPPHWPISQ